MMMEPIDVKVSDALKQSEKTIDREVVSSMEKAVSEFKEMVNQGIAQPRGYRLQTIDSRMSSVVHFNM